MGLVDKVLEKAEDNWRKVIKTEFPLFGNIPVKKSGPNPKNSLPWRFYTNNKELHIDIYKPEVIEKLFDDVIKKLYHGTFETKVSDKLVERLIHDNFLYLYHHEQFHPLFCPDGKTDKMNFDLALYEGISEGEPHLSRLDVERKSGNVRNAAWDQIIDTTFFCMSNYGNKLGQRINRVIHESDVALNDQEYLPSVLPIFDIIAFETQKEEFKSMFYPITRAIYGLLFVQNKTMRVNVVNKKKKKISKTMKLDELDRAMGDALKGFAKELSKEELSYSRVDPQKFYESVDQIVKDYKSPKSDDAHQQVIETISKLALTKQTRYSSVKGFIKTLGKYVSLDNEEPRHGFGSGEGNGQEETPQSDDNQTLSNTEEVMLNLAEMLPEGEANQLLAEGANQYNYNEHNGGVSQKNKRLIQLAKDEYYKRNTKEILIRSSEKEAFQFELGKRIIPVYQSTSILTPQDMINLNLEKILLFQQETGIIQLFQLSENQFRLDHYEFEEITETDYTFKNEGIHLPDNLVFHVDSSGSMGNPNYVGSGDKYDTLMHVCYGIIKTMKNASEDMKKPVNVVCANFSNGTLISKPSELVTMYNSPNNDTKAILTGFQGGGTEYSVDSFGQIKKLLKPGKTVHVWITDGELEHSCQEPVLKGIEKEVQDENTSFLYFEIGSTSRFGRSLEELSNTHSNLSYYPNTSIEDIQNNALEILIAYSKRK